MAINLNDMMQGGFSGSSGPSGDVINVGGRRLKKTPMGWQDIETGDIFDGAGAPQGTPQSMPQGNQLADVVNNPSQALPSQGPMGNLVNGQPMGAQQQPENFFQRSGGERVSLRPDTGWTTQGGKSLVPKAATARNDPWSDGPKVMEERTLPDGRVLRMVQKPTMDGFGRQSSMTVPEISDPNAERARQMAFDKEDATIDKLRSEAEKNRAQFGEDGKPMTAYQREQLRMKQEKTSKAAAATRNYANSNADMIEKSLADILGVPVADLGKTISNKDAMLSRIAPVVGTMDARTPDALPGSVDIASSIDNLRDKSQMFGLSNLRNSGVAPGSITEKEWPKFGATIGNLDRKLSEPAFIKQLTDIYQMSQQLRQGGELDYKDLTEGLSGQEQPAQQSAPQSFGQNANQLMKEAQEAIAKGAPRDAVMQRLQEKLRGG